MRLNSYSYNYITVVDLGFEMGGFQWGGQSLPGRVAAYLRGSGGMPPRNFL